MIQVDFSPTFLQFSVIGTINKTKKKGQNFKQSSFILLS